MVTIWFEPHSTTEDNEAGVSSGWNDVDLSELGLKQAQEMVERCKDRGISAIFVSDMQRAIKSVRPLADALHLPVYIDSRLRECNYGDLNGAPKEQVERLKLEKIADKFPNGECYIDCTKRIGEFLVDVQGDFDGETILVVGHRATQYGIESIALKKPLPDIVLAPWKWQPGWKYELH